MISAVERIRDDIAHLATWLICVAAALFVGLQTRHQHPLHHQPPQTRPQHLPQGRHHQPPSWPQRHLRQVNARTGVRQTSRVETMGDGTVLLGIWLLCVEAAPFAMTRHAMHVSVSLISTGRSLGHRAEPTHVPGTRSSNFMMMHTAEARPLCQL